MTDPRPDVIFEQYPGQFDPIAIKAAIAALEAHERWEADVILHGDWSGSTVRLTQTQHDALPAVQAKRNEALAFLRAVSEPAP